MSGFRPFVLIIAAVELCAAATSAHEVRPAYLEIRETSPQTYDAAWKVPARGQMRLGVHVRLPSGTRELTAPIGRFTDDAYIERWRFACDGGLDGHEVRIDGLEATRIDALVRVEHLGDTTQTVRLLPSAPSFVVQASPSHLDVASIYLKIGIEHILSGIDHLLFVLALMLLVRGWKRLFGTITAFTVAHSVTLSLATLGVINAPGPPVEACIALSIVFVAAEIARRRESRIGLAEQQPWLVAFAFGLLHGFGFAGALSQIGLPQHAIPLALLFFNLGVEIGQLLFIALFVSLNGVVRKWLGFVASPRLRFVPAYGIGSVAMYWLIARIAAF